ncbi:MAG: GNAT family N-acetyltransferase [Candidatus Velthaea sp.]
MIETERFIIELPAPQHAAGLAAYYERNAEHLRRWEPQRPQNYFMPAFHAAAIPRDLANAKADRGYYFVAFERTDLERVAASINLSNIVRGVFQACHLGYSIDAALQGRGLASEAVGAVVNHAFAHMRLHRVMANYHPANERSGNLLRRLGFVVEGYARDYLFIDGAWRDSILTSKVNPDQAFRPYLAARNPDPESRP